MHKLLAIGGAAVLALWAFLPRLPTRPRGRSRRSTHTEENIFVVDGVRRSVGDTRRNKTVGVRAVTSWKAKYGGMEVSDARRLRALEAENGKLKRLLAEAHLDNAALKDVLGRKW